LAQDSNNLFDNCDLFLVELRHMMGHRNKILGEEMNKNTEWLGQKGFWAFYVILLFLLRLFIGPMLTVLSLSDGFAWFIIHCMHTAITFVILHWLKGSPFWLTEDQGRYDNLTFWEQIDHGRQYTRNRKLMTLVPVVLFVLASYSCNWDFTVSSVSFLGLLVVLIPKLGYMHGVRVAGINEE